MIGLGIIGLGVQGRRMLARLAEHDRLRAVAGWDPQPASLRGTGSDLPLARSPDELLLTAGVQCVYIASPPASHLEHAHRAFDAGLPVFCEKPLAVDFAEARLAISRIEREKLHAAVNFSLAASPGLAAVEAAAAGKELGALREVRIGCAFREWPRPWQAAAGRWLAGRDEGGFTREVLSHFVFVLQRVLGKAEVVASSVTYPDDGVGSERKLSARLLARGVPVSIEGEIGGEAADDNRFELVFEGGTAEFREWLSSRRGAPPLAPPGGRPPYLGQLDQLADFVEGRPHALPGFAEALAVQQTIEALLAPGPGSRPPRARGLQV